MIDRQNCVNTKSVAGTSRIEDVLDDARNGRMFILVDGEDDEGEGGLVIPAQFVTPRMINFMAKQGRGLICLALTKERVDQLRLEQIQPEHCPRYERAFTVSIEAREGVTTGISAADRARTIQTAVDCSKGPDDIVTPGHVFPLVAREGGVLVRPGHTEAAVDIARLAGLTQAGVICKIMNPDGSMARPTDLISFARDHGLRMGVIRDLISYRLQHDTIIEKVMDEPFVSEFGGDWRIQIYLNKTDGTEHFALLKGKVDATRPAMVSVHTVNLMEDLFGRANGRPHQLNAAMLQIARHGCGTIVIPRQIGGTSARQYVVQEPTPARKRDRTFRTLGLGCAILNAMGVRKLILLNKSDGQPIVGLEGFGLEVVEQRAMNDPPFGLKLVS